MAKIKNVFQSSADHTAKVYFKNRNDVEHNISDSEESDSCQKYNMAKSRTCGPPRSKEDMVMHNNRGLSCIDLL